MKKLFYVLALASFSFVACNSGGSTEATTTDSPAVEAPAVEAPAVVDSAAAVVDSAAAAATPAQ